MSSFYGGDGGGVAAASQLYFCHQCNRTVSITLSSPSSELSCPDCNGGFLEEYENPNPNPNPNPQPFFTFSSDNISPYPPSFQSSGFVGPSPFFLSTSASATGGAGHDPIDLSTLFGLGGDSNRFQSPDEFNPFMFLQNYLNTRGVQFVVGDNNAMDATGFRLPNNLGDYFIGPGLEQLIQQLAENDPNRYGTPPASKSAVEALPTIKITSELLDCDSSQCAVCKDIFNLDEEAKQMPCKHIYHPDCIMPWLEMHNSCPVCRYELPTDDPEYENRARGGTQSGGGGMAFAGAGGGGMVFAGAGGSQENPDAARIERRFRVQLPWPFRMTGEPSNSTAGNSGSRNNNAGGSDLGSQAREEDLD